MNNYCIHCCECERCGRCMIRDTAKWHGKRDGWRCRLLNRLLPDAVLVRL